MRTSPALPMRLVLGVACLLTGSTLLAAPQGSSQRGDTYESIARLPDWSGIWVFPFQAFIDENRQVNDPASTSGPQLSAAASAQRAAARRRLADRDTLVGKPVERSASCGAPGGMPGVMRFPFGVELLFTPGRVTMLLEQGPMVRRIYTDRRRHSVDPDPTYAGESIGHWEGDTLVVETRSIHPTAQLIAGISVSEKIKIIERIRLLDPTHLRIDTTVEDPVMLVKPWTTTRVYERSSAGPFERYCDNNRDADDREPDLTPPPRQ
jgi:hypothetical protein